MHLLPNISVKLHCSVHIFIDVGKLQSHCKKNHKIVAILDASCSLTKQQVILLEAVVLPKLNMSHSTKSKKIRNWYNYHYSSYHPTYYLHHPGQGIHVEAKAAKFGLKAKALRYTV